MVKSQILIVLLLCSLLLSPMAGCIPAGKREKTLLAEYHQYALRSSPQHRVGALTPVPGVTKIPLQTFTDENGVVWVNLSLQEAVYRSLANSLEIKIVSFSPAIAREQWIEAAAIFDTIVFARGDWRRATGRSPGTSPVFPFDPTVNRTVSETFFGEVGLRQPLITGGTAEVFYSIERSEVDPPAGSVFDPAYSQRTGVRLTQPLLRNAGTDVSLARVRVTRINYRIAMSQFSGQVMEIVSQVQAQYWQLVQARQNLLVEEDLLARTVQTYEQVRARGELEATAVQITQALAAVETRRAALIRTRKQILDIQDQLIRTIADPQITLIGDAMILPTTQPSRVELLLDRADQIATALRYSPELEQSRLAIQANDINVRVARNQTLPRLDFQGAASLSGIDSSVSESWRQMWTFDFVDYSASLLFEYPLGNRAAEAALRRARFERAQSITELQNTADQVALAVNEAVRRIEASYAEMQAQQEAIRANRANLEAIEYRQAYRAALTPEFLELKLNAQANLAFAELSELRAVVDYNIAQATLARATGTALSNAGIVIADIEPSEDVVDLMRARVPVPAVAPTPRTVVEEEFEVISNP